VTEPGIEVELIEGGNGVFDVLSDGDRVFSKHQEGRFPAAGEVLALLRARMAAEDDGPR